METKRTLKVKLISASNLKNVREMFQMKVYAEVSILGTKLNKFCTPVDKVNTTNPVWNYKVKFRFDEGLLFREDLMLVVKLYCKRTLGDRYIGEVCISTEQLLHKAEPGKWTGFRPSLEKRGAAPLSRGELTLLYKFESVCDSSSEEEIDQEEDSQEIDQEEDSQNSADDSETSFWDSSFDKLTEGLKNIFSSSGSSGSDSSD